MGCFRGSTNVTKEVAENDVENVMENQEEGPVKANAKSQQKKCTLKMVVLSILLSLAIVVGSATAALWPRDVTWQLTDLDVEDESSLMFYVRSFGTGVKNDTKLPDLVFHAGADFENPNLLGGTAKSGEFQVFYHDQVLGGGQSEPVEVPSRGHGMVKAKVRVTLNHNLLQQLTADVLQHSLHAIVKVKGGATVTSIFGLQLYCRIDCDIEASVTELFGATRQAVVENKKCTYSYF